MHNCIFWISCIALKWSKYVCVSGRESICWNAKWGIVIFIQAVFSPASWSQEMMCSVQFWNEIFDHQLEKFCNFDLGSENARKMLLFVDKNGWNIIFLFIVLLCQCINIQDKILKFLKLGWYMDSGTDPHDQEKCENPEKCDLCMVSNIGIKMRKHLLGTLVNGTSKGHLSVRL